MKNMDANVGTTQDNTEPTPTFDNHQDEILYKKKLIKEAIDSGDWVTATTLMSDIKSLDLEVEAEQHNNNIRIVEIPTMILMKSIPHSRRCLRPSLPLHLHLLWHLTARIQT